jgi:hypothetical protein
MTRADLYKLTEIVDAIKAGRASVADLKPYSEITITAAVKELIAAEREECAILAEDAADEGGALDRGGKQEEVDAAKRELCQEIARRIRARRD